MNIERLDLDLNYLDWRNEAADRFEKAYLCDGFLSKVRIFCERSSVRHVNCETINEVQLTYRFAQMLLA